MIPRMSSSARSAVLLTLAVSPLSSFATDFDVCGALECEMGCLVLRADDGNVYEFSQVPDLWRGAHRVRVTGTVEPSCTRTCPPNDGCISDAVIAPCHAAVGAFSSTEDFEKGEFINLNAAGDELQINTWQQTKTADPPLSERREAEYPAYPEFPARILKEHDLLRGALYVALPQVRVPALLIHSRADTSVSPDSMPCIHERLGSPDKQMLWLDGMDHSLVRDPQRQVVFDAVAAFVAGHAT